MNARRWYSVNATAAALGLHPVSVRRLISQGKIPAGKIGRAVRVDFSALESDLERQAKGEPPQAKSRRTT